MNDKLIELAKAEGFVDAPFLNPDGSNNFYCTEKQLENVCEAYHAELVQANNSAKLEIAYCSCRIPSKLKKLLNIIN